MRPLENPVAGRKRLPVDSFHNFRRNIDMRKLAITTIATLAFACGTAFAQSGNVAIPGLISGKGSAGSEVTNSKISVTNNKATNVIAGGGKAGIKVAEISMEGLSLIHI